MVPKICSVDGCDNAHNARGFCPMHYQRWKNHGSPLWEPPVKPTTCSVDGCLKASAKRGYCNMHYIRWRTKGDVGPAGTVVNVQNGPCTAEGCSRNASARDLCKLHYDRVARSGSLDAIPSTAGQWNGMWKGEAASYFAIHQRLKAERGRATKYACTECDGRARHWAYDNADPNERKDDGGRYSTDLNHYRPMCVSCHRKFDFKHSKEEAVS